jgi:hypothetical protein
MNARAERAIIVPADSAALHDDASVPRRSGSIAMALFKVVDWTALGVPVMPITQQRASSFALKAWAGAFNDKNTQADSSP